MAKWAEIEGTSFGDEQRALYIRQPWMDKATYEQTIEYITLQTAEPFDSVSTARYTEWVNLDSAINIEHADKLRYTTKIYKRAKLFQESVDKLFRLVKPQEASKISESIIKQYGSVHQRWAEAQRIAQDVSKVLGEPHRDDFKVSFLQRKDITPEDMTSNTWKGKPSKMIVHARAKSDFSIWAKILQHKVNIDEIFDTVGVQVVTEDVKQARKLHDKFLDYVDKHPEEYKRMLSYDFARPEERAKIIPPKEPTHNPDRDYLNKPNPNKYVSYRTNLIDMKTGKIFEIQFTPIKNYKPPEKQLKKSAFKATIRRNRH